MTIDRCCRSYRLQHREIEVVAVTWVKDIDSLFDFIGYVVIYAPDRFPVEDYLAPGEQMTLAMAFDELRYGLT